MSIKELTERSKGSEFFLMVCVCVCVLASWRGIKFV